MSLTKVNRVADMGRLCVRIACGLALLPILTACLGPTLGRLSGAANMTIEVEVYKGPLSKEKKTQEAELEAKRTFEDLQDNARISLIRLACIAMGTSGIKPKSKSDEKIQFCPNLKRLVDDAEFIASRLELLAARSYRAQPGNYRYETAKIAEWLRTRARTWATVHSATWPEDKRVRIDMAHFTNFAADYGNQLGAMADMLEKQDKGNDRTTARRNQLPSSVFLRDSASTHYLNIYEWNDAAVDRTMEKHDRVHAVRQLVSDTYWATVNQVFAVGQGEVGMVFVKDGKGNWNLKRYDNDPTELLEAYRDVGLAALKAVTSISGLTEIGRNSKAISQALNLADRVVGGTGDGGGIAAEIKAMHDATVKQMNAIADELQKQYGGIAVEHKAAQAPEGGAAATSEDNSSKDGKQSANSGQNQEIVTQSSVQPSPDPLSEQKRIRKETVKLLIAILDHHTAVMDQLAAPQP